MERVSQTEHGVLVAVEIADQDLERAIERLHPLDAERARSLPGGRRASFVGGRIALSRALSRLGADVLDIGSDERGAPAVPPGFIGSLSHKGTSAIAIAAVDDGARIGVDLERVRPVRPRIDARILVPEERARIAALAEDERDLAVLVSFSVKEAIYKAIDPFVRRYVAFHEAVLVLPSRAAMCAGRVSIEATLNPPLHPIRVEATVEVAGDSVVTTARARPAAG